MPRLWLSLLPLRSSNALSVSTSPLAVLTMRRMPEALRHRSNLRPPYTCHRSFNRIRSWMKKPYSVWSPPVSRCRVNAPSRNRYRSEASPVALRMSVPSVRSWLPSPGFCHTRFAPIPDEGTSWLMDGSSLLRPASTPENEFT